MVLVFVFLPAGEGNCLVLKTTLLDHGDLPYRSRHHMDYFTVLLSSATGKVKGGFYLAPWSI